MTSKRKEPMAWAKVLPFTDETYLFQFIRTLGASYSGGADLLECLETAARLTEKDGESWYREWLETAERLRDVGDQAKRSGHLVSAGEAYLRASNYYRTAEFFIHADPTDDRILHVARLSRECFVDAIKYSRFNMEVVEIPYEGTTLPGYFIKSPVAKSEAPLFISHTGFDGTAEEMYFFFGPQALDRGYHCLFFDGPGQGMALRDKGLHLRPDWEHVITPVVDFSLDLPGVDKERIVYCGISMGGYFAPRALAFEHRIKLGVAHGAIFSVAGPLYQMLGPDLVVMAENAPEDFQKAIEPRMEVPKVKWFMDDGMWKYGVSSPAEAVTTAARYTMDDLADKIQTPMLITAGSHDHLAAQEAKKLYDALVCRKTYVEFTPDEAAETHCQCGAYAIAGQKIFDWLDENL